MGVPYCTGIFPDAFCLSLYYHKHRRLKFALKWWYKHTYTITNIEGWNFKHLSCNRCTHVVAVILIHTVWLTSAASGTTQQNSPVRDIAFPKRFKLTVPSSWPLFPMNLDPVLFITVPFGKNHSSAVFGANLQHGILSVIQCSALLEFWGNGVETLVSPISVMRMTLLLV